MKNSIKLDVGELTDVTLAEVQKKIGALLALDKPVKTLNELDTYDTLVRIYALDDAKLAQRTREIVVNGRWPNLGYYVTDSVSPDLLPAFEEGTGRLGTVVYNHAEIK